VNKISLIINTVTKNKDVWPMFFGQLEKHLPKDIFNEKHIFVNHCEESFPMIIKCHILNLIRCIESNLCRV